MLPLAAVYGLFGLVLGSFLNVCIYRIPLGKSVVRPGSRCPKCGAPVRPYDNVPVLAYLWLLGRCRDCKAPISPRYPAVELLTGISFALAALEWGPEPAAAVNAIFMAIVIILVFIDYDHQILPNVLTIPGTVLGILLSPLQDSSLYEDPLSIAAAAAIAPGNPDAALPWVGSLIGAFLGAGILYTVARVYTLVRHRQGLGMGDVKMMAMVGAFLGWRLALLTIFAGSFLGSIVGIGLILFRGQSMQTKLAFGTFLGAGAVLSMFFGLTFIRWYVGIR